MMEFVSSRLLDVFRAASVSFVAVLFSCAATAQTKIVLLGTGTPRPFPDRSGPATAIVVDDRAYLVDAGPGVIRRAEAAVEQKGVAALDPAKLTIAFITDRKSTRLNS